MASAYYIYILLLILGVVIGYIIGNKVSIPKGDLNIVDDSQLYLSLHVPVKDISHKNFVCFRIKRIYPRENHIL